MTSNKGLVLVTGGAGFIGSYIVEALLASGYGVRVLDVLEAQVHGDLATQGSAASPVRPVYLSPEAELIVGDVCDPATVQRALDGVDLLIHEAALVGVGQSMYDIRRYTQGNSLGAATVLDVAMNTPAIRTRLRKMVVASSMSIYGEGAYRCAVHGAVTPRLRPQAQLALGEWEVRCPEPGCAQTVSPVPTPETKQLQPLSVYAIGKRDHEELFLAVGAAYDIPAVALRYWQVYGARQALSNPYTGVAAIFCSRLLAGNPPPIYEDGLQLRDFVHAKDVARANVLALESSSANGQAINVGTGQGVSIHDVALTLTRSLAALGALGGPRGDDASGLAPRILGTFRPGDTRHCIPDVTRARELLGFEAQISFELGATELALWVRDQQGTVSDHFDQAQQELRQHGLLKA